MRLRSASVSVAARGFGGLRLGASLRTGSAIAAVSRCGAGGVGGPLLDRLARLQAEFDNARKRAVREQQDFREYAATDVIKNFLPVLDSFERALKVAGESGSNSNSNEFRNGIDLIYRQFQDALQKSGVQPIIAVGQPFDPRIHEAVEMVDTTGVPDHHVLEELQRGYKLKDRLLRPSMVKVARNSKA